MPTTPPPPELQEMLRQPNPCVMATITPDGPLQTAATWYDWLEDGTVLVNMDASRRRLGYIRNDPRVGLTVLDNDNWYRHVSLIGKVGDIRPDADLADIDRLSRRYSSVPYANRERERWTVIIGVDRWHGWENGRDLAKRV